MCDLKIYRQFLSHCDNGFALIEADGGIIDVNAALCGLTGRSEETLLGAGIDILFDDFSVEKILRIYNAYDCHEISHTISGELQQKDGEPQMVEIHVNCTSGEHWLLIKNNSFRIEMENKLRQSELMLSTTLESLPFDFWINDADNRTWMQNSYSKALWGDVKGTHPDEVGADDAITDKWMETTDRALKGEVVEGELTYTIDGRKRTFRNILAPVTDDEKLLGILGMNIDITDLKEALNSRDLLLKEIHHRVKNNLQMISSLINIEASELEDEHSRAVFEDLVNRIEAVSLVHEKLYTSDANNIVRTADYIRDLVDHIISGVQTGSVLIEYQLDNIDLELDRIILLGLIINELVTNSAKYAFSGTGRQVLKVVLRKRKNDIVVEVIDNGPGLPESCDELDAPSLGFRMMDAMSEQLGGRLERKSSSNGCSSRLVFPIKKTEA